MPTRQYAALPYLIRDGEIAVLLVTSRRHGRWILPKGNPIKGFEPAEVAAREALEEAGVEGHAEPHPIGRYKGVKLRGKHAIPLHIELYPLKVEREFDDWKERGDRQRRWTSPDEAAELLADDTMAKLIKTWTRSLA